MSSRPSDDQQPTAKRRAGSQISKDDADDEEAPVGDPGTWGKADGATMARRKVVRARRAGGAAPADQPPAPAAAPEAGANPFAGVSLTAPSDGAAAPAANPFAGVSLMAAAAAPAADAKAAAASEPAAAAQAAAEPAAEPAGKAEAATGKAAAADAAAEVKEPEQAAAKPDSAAAAPESGKQEPDKQEPDKAQAAAAAPLFGSSSTGGFGGGFGSLAAGSSGGFGGGGFGGFAAAAKDGASGGSLFGSYTAPQPGSSLFAPVPAFGAARASKGSEGGAEAGDADAAEGAEGEGVFGGAEVAPVVSLSEVPKQTGEENEDTKFAAEGALFEFVNGKEWRERGRGELRVNVSRAGQQARLVMRQRGSQRLLLNANLYPRMAMTRMVGGKGVTFAAANAAPAHGDAGSDAGAAGSGAKAADGEGAGEAGKEQQPDSSTKDSGDAGGGSSSMKTYAFRVKSADKIDSFVAVVDSCKARAAAAAGAPSTAAAAPEPPV